MELPKIFKDEIWDYCRVNNISNIDEFTFKLIKQGFTIEKFGATPIANEKIIEVEKIVEKIVEVPVDKEVFITDDFEVKKLTDKIVYLQESLTKTINDRNSDVFVLEQQIIEKTKEVNRLTNELEELKLKKKKDLYGE